LEKVLLTQTSERDDRHNTPLDIIGNFLLALSQIDRSQSRRHNARVPESGGVRLANAIVIDTNSIEPVVRLWRRAAWFSGISTDGKLVEIVELGRWYQRVSTRSRHTTWALGRYFAHICRVMTRSTSWSGRYRSRYWHASTSHFNIACRRKRRWNRLRKLNQPRSIASTAS